MFLIGSRAAQYYGLKLFRASGDVNNSDWDIIGSKAEMDFFLKNFPDAEVKETSHSGKFHIRMPNTLIEFDATDNPSNQILTKDFLALSEPHHFVINGKKTLLFVPPKIILYEIKRSHANFGIHFDKTISDLRRMMKEWSMYGLHDIVQKSEFYKERFKEAKDRFGERQKRIKLNKPNSEFFKGGMDLRTYVHDDLHRAVAYYDEPIFERCKKDMNSAFVSKELFFSMPYEDQVRMAMEESMVIALERFYIPARDSYKNCQKKTLDYLYRKGMMKEIKDLSKGWFQDFMIDNILDIETPKWNYIENFETALKNGKVRKL